MDQWCNLRVRFRHGWPDYVGAIDAAQSDALARLGFAGENVLVVGHPWLAELVESRAAHTATPKTPRDRDAVCVLFVSENIAEDVANGRNAPFGFDEIDSFDVLYRAASAAAELGTKVSVAVKCHAYEDPARFRKYLEGLTPPPLMRVASVPPGGNPRAWVLWSDLIVGISSMLLLEAMVLDRPVISVQPGLQRENTFQAGVNGYARTLTDPAEAVSVMTQMIRDPEERRVALDGHRKFTDTLERDCVEPVLRWIRSRATRHA